METAVQLVQSSALVVLAGISLTLIGQRLQQSPVPKGILVGILFGAVGIVSMALPVEVGPGYRVDARDVAVAISAPAGGTIGVLITAAVVALTRIYFGGAGMLEGVFNTCVVAAGCALFWASIRQKDEGRIPFGNLLYLSIIAAISPIFTSIVLWISGLSTPSIDVLELAVPTIFGGTLLWGVLIALDSERRWALATVDQKEEELQAVTKYVSEAPQSLDLLVHSLATQLQAMTNNVPGVLFQLYLDKDGQPRFRFVSKGSDRLLGIPPEKLVERPGILLEMMSRETLEEILTTLHQSADHFEAWSHEAKFVRQDGRSLWMRIAAEPRRDPGGNLVWDGSMFDITQEKSNVQMKNEFISTVNHELRTPLTSIRGSLGLVTAGAAGPLPDKAAALIRIAHTNSERLVRLINDILDIEKIEAGRMTFELQPQPLKPLIEQAIEGSKGYLVEHGVDIAFADHAPGTKANIDGHRVNQVLINLLSNAIKFSPKNATVEIALRLHGDQVRISVTDHGPGIDEEFRDRIFNKFEQADASDSREKGGTGLGLSIVKALVEGMNGSVSFDTERGVGTTFHVDFPAILPDEAAAPGLPRILICEDEIDIARIIAISLEEEGFACDIAVDAATAKAFLSQRDYVAMTLDIRLANESGIALLNEVRRLKSGASLPVIVISAVANEARKQINGSAIGIVDWLEKPLDFQRLKDAVRRMREGQYERNPSVLHVEDDEDVLDVVAATLGDDISVSWARTVSEARTKLGNSHFDVVILDLDLPDESGESLLDGIPPETAVIIFSATDVEEKLAKKVRAAMTKTRTSELSIASLVRNLVASDWGAAKTGHHEERPTP